MRRLGANRGPIATIDRGLQFVLKDFGEADYVITLDEDVSLRPDFLVEFVRKADRTPSDVGMIASNQFCLDAHHRGLHRSTGHYVTRAGAAMDRGFHLRKAPKRPAILCPCLSGALFKMELLKDLGGICTDYYQYYGCIEFGFRAQLSGWRCEFAELAKMRHWGRVRHLHGKSLAIREISRVWSIFSFFPKQVVPKALETYRLECRDFSPLKRAAFIQEAERSLPQIWDDEEMKNRVYHNFVEPNEPKAPCPCER